MDPSPGPPHATPPNRLGSGGGWGQRTEGDKVSGRAQRMTATVSTENQEGSPRAHLTNYRTGSQNLKPDLVRGQGM